MALQKGRHFAGDIFKRIFLEENVCILIQISLKFKTSGIEPCHTYEHYNSQVKTTNYYVCSKTHAIQYMRNSHNAQEHDYDSV